jgi:N-acetylglucosaminyl-diphospho-decaprenol L-rhamnosyltransferase
VRSSQTSIIIVNWNGSVFLTELLRSIDQEGNFKTVVIDNASSDESLQILAKFPDVIVITNQENRGYGAAANQGFEICTTPYVLLLNADMKILPGSIHLMEQYLDSHPEVALVSPCLLFPDGKLQPSIRSFPTAWSIALYLSYLDRILPSNYRKKAAGHTVTQEVDQPMGAAMMFRKRVLEEVGFFDSQFFLYMEDVDLCYRIKQKRYKIVYLQESKMIHQGGGSSQQDWERSQGNFLDSLVLYFKNHAPDEERKLKWLLPPALLLRSLVLLVCGKFRESGFYLKRIAG